MITKLNSIQEYAQMNLYVGMNVEMNIINKFV